MKISGSRSLIALLAAAPVMLNACSGPQVASARDVADANDTGRTLSPQTATERLVLQRLSQLPNGTPRRVGDTSVVADAPYHAASGHTCRAIQLAAAGQTPPIGRRLACTDGRGWFFVPDVFVGGLKD